MKILCTYVSAERPELPALSGLHVVWADQSNWPTNNPVYCCEVDDDAETDQPGVLQVLTEDEAEALHTLEMQLRYNKAANNIRRQRDAVFATTVDRINPMRWIELSSEQQAQWIAYRQALKDITTQSSFPFEVQWPEPPAGS